MSTLRLISNEVKLAFGLLSPIDRTKLAWLSILQVLVSILDLLAIFFLGVITSSTLVSIQGSSPMIPWQITTALEALGFNNASFNQMIAFLGIVTSTLLVLRSITSAVLARKIFIFLSSRSATASSKLFEDILSAGYPLFFNSSPSEIQYTVIRSVNALFLGIVGSTAILLTEALIIFLMFIGLASFDLTLAAITFLYFSTISILLSSKFGGRIQRHNQELSKNYIKNESKVIEIVSLYREISLRGSIQYFVDNFALVRMRSAKILARTQFIPLIIKYWMEISFIVGALLISGVQFLQYSAT